MGTAFWLSLLLDMLFDQIQRDFISAMKARDEFKRETLKMLLAALKDAAIEAFGSDRTKILSDDVARAVLRKELKKRQEAIALYQQAGRQDLVDKESAEAAMVESYLPQLLSKEAVVSVVVGIVGANAYTATDFGKVMGATMAQLKGQADGKMVGEVVKETLAGVLG